MVSCGASYRITDYRCGETNIFKGVCHVCMCSSATGRWEDDGANGIRPNTPDVNITPNPSSPGDDKNMVGTPNHPWDGATFASPNFTLLFHANRGAERILRALRSFRIGLQ